MNKPLRTTPAPEALRDGPQATPRTERRRYDRSVLDAPDRGASGFWLTTAARRMDTGALTLQEPEPAGTAARSGGYDPYESLGGGPRQASRPARPARTDLRRLSEHIKQMRRLATRGPDDPDGQD